MKSNGEAQQNIIKTVRKEKSKSTTSIQCSRGKLDGIKTVCFRLRFIHINICYNITPKLPS